MPHIHELIDWTVTVFITYNEQVLLIHHKQLQKWLPVGGHIELDEDPEQALLREVQEEAGIEIQLLANKPEIPVDGGRMLPTPDFMDIHAINETHKHIGLVYIAKALGSDAKLAEAEHNEIRWFSRDELNDPKYNILPNIRFYCEQALDQTAEMKEERDSDGQN